MRSFVLALVITLVPLSARADERELARHEFTLGQDADKRGQWQLAVVHYLRANQLVPHPFTAFQIAHDYEQLGQLREAARWYGEYLAGTTDANDRAKVERQVAELRRRPSKIAVRSVPDGARVTIDNIYAGTTPYAGVVRGGAHRVNVDANAGSESRDVVAEFGEPLDVAFQLQPSSTGTLVVTGPPGAVILIDGAPSGTTPTTLVLPAGPHAIHVQAPGYQPYDAQTVVPANDTARVDAPVISTLPGIARLSFHYIFALGGGIDARTTGGIEVLGFGIRISRLDFLAYLGKDNNNTAINVIGRWTFLPSRFSPFLAGGYAYVQNGFGVQATAGLRYDVARSERAAVSLLVEAGARYTSGTDMNGNSQSGVEIPILGSLEILYGYGGTTR